MLPPAKLSSVARDLPLHNKKSWSVPLQSPFVASISLSKCPVPTTKSTSQQMRCSISF